MWIVDRTPRSSVPNDDFAAPVLTPWNGPLEVRVVDGMIFDLYGEAFLAENEARPFRNRPAFKDSVELEPKVVMKTARSVLLDDEPLAACRRNAGGRLRRNAPPAPPGIFGQGAGVLHAACSRVCFCLAPPPFARLSETLFLSSAMRST